MESDDNHPNLAGDALRGPREVACFKAEGAVLSVPTSCTDEMNSLWANTSVGFLSAAFKSALLPCKNLSFQVGTYVRNIWAFYYAR